MANLTNNRLSIILEADALKKILIQIQEINNLLPFLIGLNTEERVKLPKIDGSNRLFVQDTLKVMKQNGAIMPNFVNVEELEKDFILYEQLDAVLSAVNQLQEKLRDTQMLAGSEAYSSALMAYRMFQMAADAGLAGMDTVVDDLKQRFAGQGSSETKPTV
jgi:hypothetical protein